MNVPVGLILCLGLIPWLLIKTMTTVIRHRAIYKRLRMKKRYTYTHGERETCSLEVHTTHFFVKADCMSLIAQS